MGAEQNRYNNLKREMEQRELHHFEAEQALSKIKHFVLSAQEFGDELDHEDILRMIPKDI